MPFGDAYLAGKPGNLPMRRYVTEPINAGGLERNVEIEATGNGLIDEGLFLLGQKLNEPLLGADIALDAAVSVIELANDGGLFVWGWYKKFDLSHSHLCQVPLAYPNSVRCLSEERYICL